MRNLLDIKIKKKILAIDLAALIAIAALLWVRIDRAPFFIDEVVKVGWGYYYGLLFERWDIHSPDWHNYAARTELPIGKYIFGFGMKLQNYPIVNLRIYNAYSLLWEKPEELKNVIPFYLIVAGRRISWLFSTLSIWLTYILTKKAAGIAAGVIAAALLLINPISVIFVQALSDSMLLATLALGALIVTMWSEGREKLDAWKIWIVAILVGILSGIAPGIKANGAILGVYLFLATAWICLRSKSKPSSVVTAAAALIAAGSISVVVFIALNPMLYSHPIEEIKYFLANRAQDVAYQRVHIGPSINDGVFSKFWIVANRVLVSGPYVPFKFVGIFSFVGIWHIIRNYIKKSKSENILLLIWCLVLYCSVPAWIPLDWDRYYLPAAAAVAILAAIGIVATLNQAKMSLVEYLNKSRPAKDFAK